ncbi:Metallo-dependent phosphatase-like protein [Haematococcus lacustris]
MTPGRVACTLLPATGRTAAGWRGSWGAAGRGGRSWHCWWGTWPTPWATVRTGTCSGSSSRRPSRNGHWRWARAITSATGQALGTPSPTPPATRGGECNVPFLKRWHTPANVKQDPFTSYYSFRQGPVHFMVLDSESPSHPDSPQGRWVAAELARVERSLTPWLVVSLHRMMHAPASWRRRWVGDLDNMERLQRDYQDLFVQHGVDLVLQGHEHAYARTCPLAAGSGGMRLLRGGGREQQPLARVYAAPAGGPLYMLCGNAGAGFTHGFPSALPAWVEAGAQDVNGYLRCTATRSQLRVEAVGASDGQVFDHVTLVRQGGGRQGGGGEL